jgi:hypothetical protein
MCCFALTFQFLRSEWSERRPVHLLLLLLHAHRSVLLCFCVFFLLFGTSSSPSLSVFLFCKDRPCPPRRRLLRLRLGTSPLLGFFYSGSFLYDFNGQDLLIVSEFDGSPPLLFFFVHFVLVPASFFLFTQAPFFTISTDRIFICSRIRQFSSPPVLLLLLLCSRP